MHSQLCPTRSRTESGGVAKRYIITLLNRSPLLIVCTNQTGIEIDCPVFLPITLSLIWRYRERRFFRSDVKSFVSAITPPKKLWDHAATRAPSSSLLRQRSVSCMRHVSVGSWTSRRNERILHGLTFIFFMLLISRPLPPDSIFGRDTRVRTVRWRFVAGSDSESNGGGSEYHFHQ